MKTSTTFTAPGMVGYLVAPHDAGPDDGSVRYAKLAEAAFRNQAASPYLSISWQRAKSELAARWASEAERRRTAR